MIKFLASIYVGFVLMGVSVMNAAESDRTYPDDFVLINEILNFAEDSKMEMQYVITDGPFPISNYVSDVKVSEVDAKNSKVTWKCKFEASPEVRDDMEGLFQGFYNVIIDGLETHINK